MRNISPLFTQKPFSNFYYSYKFFSISLIKPHVPTTPNQDLSHPSTHLMHTYPFPLSPPQIKIMIFFLVFNLYTCIYTMYIYSFKDDHVYKDLHAPNIHAYVYICIYQIPMPPISNFFSRND